MALKAGLAALIMAYGLMSTASIFAADLKSGEAKSAICSACHGVDGTSQDPTLPNLAGQSAEYIYDQLQAFKTGKRTNAMMNNMANGLSESDMLNLGAFYARLSPFTSNESSTLAGQGRTKYALCWGCHGENAKGGEGYPRLAGQNPAYVVAQLNNFRSGTRKNPAMASILSSLNENDFDALAAYLASLKVD